MRNAENTAKLHKDLTSSMFSLPHLSGVIASSISNAIPGTIPGIKTVAIAPPDKIKGLNPVHYHDCYELIWVSPKAGATISFIDNKSLLVNPGELMLVPFSRNHRITHAGASCIGSLTDITRDYLKYSENPEADAMLFDWGHILQWITRRDAARLVLKVSRNSACELDSVSEQITKLSSELSAVAKKRSSPMTAEYINRLTPLYRKLFSITAREFYSACSDAEKATFEKYRPTMLAVLDHIDAHLSEKITLDQLCRLSGYKSAWFLEVFRNTVGLTPIEYINFERMRRARYLIVNTDMSMGSIAADCGYQSQIYFNRVFKHYVGCTPLLYRNEFTIEWQD